MKIAKQYDDGKLTLYLFGELDHHAARNAMQVITNMMDMEMPRQVILDFGGLSFMDSSGIALILKVKRLAERYSGQLWLEHPNRQVLRVLEASGIGRVVPIVQEASKP